MSDSFLESLFRQAAEIVDLLITFIAKTAFFSFRHSIPILMAWLRNMYVDLIHCVSYIFLRLLSFLEDRF